jgi:6-phosphogluconolactonase
MSKTQIIIHNDREDLVSSTVEFIQKRIESLFVIQDAVHLVITGGSLGTNVLEALAKKTRTSDLSRLHIWWSDDRFVSISDNDKNERQAREAWLNESTIPAENIHAFPSSDDGTILEAGETFAGIIEQISPEFDLVLLGMGEDGHVASLFPGREGIPKGDWVVVEQDSPKPPAQRLSLSMKAINSAKEIIFLVSGANKAETVKNAMSGVGGLPASFVKAKNKTFWLLDSDAAALVTSS